MRGTWMQRLWMVRAISMLTGCYVPQAYQVVNDINPQYEDEDVRFRTTYYLRVFDLCRVEESGKYAKYEWGAGKFVHRTMGQFRIIKDSLYRFRMTGQAQGLFNDVRFESGTLRDYQIDPFGRTIEFDEKLNRFRAQNCDSIQQSGGNSNSCQPQRPQQTKDIPCPEGEAKETKFYLLGPEGIKELDPSERLIMAMSTDGKPLVNALQRIAGIKVQTEAEVAMDYSVKRDQARVSKASELLSTAKEELGKDGAVGESTDLSAIGVAIVDLFQGSGTYGRAE